MMPDAEERLRKVLEKRKEIAASFARDDHFINRTIGAAVLKLLESSDVVSRSALAAELRRRVAKTPSVTGNADPEADLERAVLEAALRALGASTDHPNDG